MMTCFDMPLNHVSLPTKTPISESGTLAYPFNLSKLLVKMLFASKEKCRILLKHIKVTKTYTGYYTIYIYIYIYIYVYIYIHSVKRLETI